MNTLDKNIAAAPRKNEWVGLVVCQIVALLALTVVIYFVVTHNYRALKYAVVIIPLVLIIPKPDLIPYLFIASFFTNVIIYNLGIMNSLFVMDFTILLLAASIISINKIDMKAVFDKQRALFTIMCVFLLWAIIGYVVNFYRHTPLENMTSALYVFNIAQLILAIVIFSQPGWKEYRNKLLMFFMLCAFLEVGVALAERYMAGGRSLSEFNRLTGVLLGTHHGMLSNIMTLAVGVSSTALFALRGKHEKIFAACVCAACLMLLLISGSRGSMLGLFIAVFIVIFLNVNYKWSILCAVVLSVVTALYFSTIINMIIGMGAGTISTNADLSSYGRLLIWERVYEHALYGPWLQKIFGIGVGTFNTLQFSYHLEAGTFTTGGHNNFLHVFVEAGIVGLIIFLAIFVEIIKNLVVKSRRGDNSARCFLFCTLALLFSGLTQETFWFQGVYGRFWFMYMFFYLILFGFRVEQECGLPRRADIA